MSKQPARQFVYAGTAAQAYTFIKRVRDTLPGQLAELKIHYKPGRRTWSVHLPGAAGHAAIEVYELNTARTEILFFDGYRPGHILEPLGQPFLDLADHCIAEHEKLAGPDQEISP